ncbi:MAG: 7-cyano-7-deazaguanine synthase [Phycisphaerales bacterium]|nr:MAG: 7-cyano-7-deazaguanine synthase [Phycisphaerales bacterium]
MTGRLPGPSGPSGPSGSPGPAVVLLSGGLDSATCLALARRAGHACHALTFDYGQRHQAELRCARRLAQALGARSHRVAALDAALFAGSALTDGPKVPKDRADPAGEEIPATYVPARNLVLLSMATAYAETLGAEAVYIGVNAVDYSGYPDCRPQFIEAFARAAALATRQGTALGRPVAIRAPLLHLSKAQIIQAGMQAGVDFALTSSCYDPDHDTGGPIACGRCDACTLRLKGFAEAGLRDPARYQTARLP